ncbi:MAG: endonuclease III [Spirochaetota bacterium]
MTRIKSKKIISKLKQYYGNIKSSSLHYSNIYQLVVSVVLSAQTTDKQVNSVTSILFNKYTDFYSLSEAAVSDIELVIKSVGLYKTKARNINNLSKIIVNEYNNIVPDELNKLISLPGIGRKSANVILSMGFNKPALPVDTHILRIANRIGYVNSSDPYKAEIALMNNIPEENWIESHLLFIKHGRELCKAKKPLCLICPVSKLCNYALSQ